jgi:hypothetical protein
MRPGDEQAIYPAPVSTVELDRAKLELGRMRGALRSWLNYRLRNDIVLAGNEPPGRSGKLKADAKLIVARARDLNLEQRLATQLHALLSDVIKNARLPDPNIRNNPHAAVELAQIALGDRTVAPGLAGLGSIPWLPLAIVGGVLLTITTAIKSQAELAAEKERLACIQAGACTDYGFWMKAAAVLGIGWFAWTQLGLRERVKRMK